MFNLNSASLAEPRKLLIILIYIALIPEVTSVARLAHGEAKRVEVKSVLVLLVEGHFAVVELMHAFVFRGCCIVGGGEHEVGILAS